MENEQTPKTPLKTRIKATAKKIGPYVIGATAGAAIVTLDAFIKKADRNHVLLRKIADDTIQIDRHDDGSFTVSELVPAPEQETED